MNVNKSLTRIRFALRKFTTQVKPIVTLDESVSKEIEEDSYKPKHHPGVIKSKNIQLPENLVTAINNTIEDYPIKKLISDSEVLVRHLRCRLPPIEEDNLRQKILRYQDKALKQVKDFEIISEEDENKLKQIVNDKVYYMLKQKIYNWKPVNYNEYNSLVYLIGRVAPEYAVLFKIFSEIKSRDPSFVPRSLFDFGSGVGTGTWAANFYWKNNIFEYFNVDASAEMNDLAQILLQGGKGTKEMPLKGVFYRQFLPAKNIPYDLVICAYSLLELPSLQARLEVVQNLWSKTSRYLVLVEYGTNAGFKIINEIRDFILQMDGDQNIGHVFSPCPHDKACPRFLQDDTPCNFQVTYHTLPVGRPLEVKKELFSYVIFKKGKREENTPQWPRVVRETLVRSKHSICRLCTEQGNLQEVIFTARKHGKTTYHCARSTKWGDLLPINIQMPNSDHQGENKE